MGNSSLTKERMSEVLPTFLSPTSRILTSSLAFPRPPPFIPPPVARSAKLSVKGRITCATCKTLQLLVLASLPRSEASCRVPVSAPDPSQLRRIPVMFCKEQLQNMELALGRGEILAILS